MAWFQISVEVRGDLAGAVADAFTAVGALSVTVQDAGDEPLLEPAPGETPLWSNTRVIALFDAAHKLGATNVTVVDIDPKRSRLRGRMRAATAAISKFRTRIHLAYGQRIW